MAEASKDKHALISQFRDLTGSTTEEAEECLIINEWNIESAVAEYFTSQESDIEQADGNSEAEEAQGHDTSYVPSRPRPSGAASASPSAIPVVASSRVTNAPSTAATNKKFATLKDLGNDAALSHGHDDDDDNRQQDLFAGGEKSALAVENPRDPRHQVKDILNKAKKNMSRPGGDEDPAAVSRFRGNGMTLGGDDIPSQVVPDPEAQVVRSRATVARILHFWKDGFSVEDGHLYRFDDPANGHILTLIRSGRAPLDIMGVEPDQPVDVTVHQHEEVYMQPKKKYKPFSGGGQRLGSPIPNLNSFANPEAISSNDGPPAITTESASSPAVSVDEARPTISLQIRLGDGTRLVSRFNTTHTIGDVYEFVNTSSPSSSQRDWVLMTTFPSKEMMDKSVILGDLAEFKRGGVVVQKWR